MARLPRARIKALLRKADAVSSSPERGACLEEAIAILFAAVPGVSIANRNCVSVADTQEIDILCWNERRQNGFYHLETPFLIECKNWGTAVSGDEIVYFANTMKSRACRDGILIASQGITGRPGTLTGAHFELAQAMRSGQRILVLTRSEIEALHTTAELSDKLKEKILDLVVNLTRMG
jgi:hypothetical protein